MVGLTEEYLPLFASPLCGNHKRCLNLEMHRGTGGKKGGREGVRREGKREKVDIPSVNLFSCCSKDTSSI